MYTAFLILLALALALLEIEIEGAHGWAEKLPTWYRVRGAAATLFRVVGGAKPLTGYHLVMLVFTLLVIHLPFAAGIPWSLPAELSTLAAYILWTLLWDFLWFVFNPAYGARKFRKAHVWWFARQPWVAGVIPADYLVGAAVSVLLAEGAVLLGDVDALRAQELLLCWFLIAAAVGVALAPLYRRWYGWMRRRDERESAGIFHR